MDRSIAVLDGGVCPTCSGDVLVTPSEDGVGAELTCDCCTFLVA